MRQGEPTPVSSATRSRAPLTRRQLLMGGAALLVGTRGAAAFDLVHREVGELGTTFRLRLKSAPFPSPPLPWKDPTALVFVPKGFRPSKTVDLAFFFHGNRNTVDSAWRKHTPHIHLARSGKNALMVAPQFAVKASDSRAGKLEVPGGFARLCAELLAGLADSKVVPPGAVVGRTVIGAHSGGFQPAAKCADLGGVEVHEMYFFDAMYGFSRRISEWLARDRKHRFASWYAGNLPTKWTRELMVALDRRRIPYLSRARDGDLTPEDLTARRIVFVQTQLPHGQVPGYFTRCLATSGLTDR